VSQHPSEILWSIGTATCSLQLREGRYELVLHRDGRFVLLLTVDSEDAARSLADKWLIAETRRQDR